MRWLGWCGVALVLLAPSASWQAAAEQPGRPTANPAVKAAALEREARQIETMLIAPCCWREQVSVHQSGAAEEVKQEIRTMLGAGMARQQVLDAFVERYGVRILAEPPDEGFWRILYHAPWVVGLVSAVGVMFLIRRMTSRPATTNPTRGAAAERTQDDVSRDEGDPSENERLDDELRALD